MLLKNIEFFNDRTIMLILQTEHKVSADNINGMQTNKIKPKLKSKQWKYMSYYFLKQSTGIKIFFDLHLFIA